MDQALNPLLKVAYLRLHRIEVYLFSIITEWNGLDRTLTFSPIICEGYIRVSQIGIFSAALVLLKYSHTQAVGVTNYY